VRMCWGGSVPEPSSAARPIPRATERVSVRHNPLQALPSRWASAEHPRLWWFGGPSEGAHSVVNRELKTNNSFPWRQLTASGPSLNTLACPPNVPRITCASLCTRRQTLRRKQRNQSESPTQKNRRLAVDCHRRRRILRPNPTFAAPGDLSYLIRQQQN